MVSSLARAEMFAKQFSSDLTTVQAIKPFITDYEAEEEPVEWAVSRFRLYEAEPNTIFLPDIFAQLMSEGDISTLQFSSRSSSSHRKSSHGVFFGNIECDGRKIGVAVKPHQDGDAWSPAAREQMVTDAFRKFGFHTLKPMGVALFDDDEQGPRAYGFTRLYEGLTTFDSLNWRYFYDEVGKHPAMRSMWRSLARTFATMHDRGTICHNDAWGRNAATSLFNPGFEIDEEHAEISVKEPLDADARFGKSFMDVMTIGKTVCYPEIVPYDREQGLEIVSDHRSQKWFKVFNDVFFKTYIAERRRLAYKHSNSEQRDIHDEVGQLILDMQTFMNRMQERHLDLTRQT